MLAMKNDLYSFLSRLALCGLAAPLILLSPALVRADAITTFDLLGSAKNISGVTLGSCAAGATCPFSGMFQVDTTKGTVESRGFDITFRGLLAFTNPIVSERSGNGWRIVAINNPRVAQLALSFSTAPTSGSLVGFTGGSILAGEVEGELRPILLDNFSGSITPVPEPSSLVLVASGMLALGLTRRLGKKVGHPLSDRATINAHSKGHS